MRQFSLNLKSLKRYVGLPGGFVKLTARNVSSCPWERCRTEPSLVKDAITSGECAAGKGSRKNGIVGNLTCKGWAKQATCVERK